MRSRFDGIAMRRFQEQSEPDFSPPMKEGDVVLLIRRMSIVRHGQDRLLAAIQRLSDAEVAAMVGVSDRMMSSQLR